MTFLSARYCATRYERWSTEVGTVQAVWGQIIMGGTAMWEQITMGGGLPLPVIFFKLVVLCMRGTVPPYMSGGPWAQYSLWA